MSFLTTYGGLALILIGAILLLLHYLSWLSGNVVLIVGLVLIICGIILHVWLYKHNEKY